ncbi:MULTISPECIES: helix-turn-helix transcriptional regulator [Olsenella]|uniref:helix-turn-helix transcriptional regulator n=1 Tax=Olsenella TaxID=133925 RepID=UPI000231F0AF|nr:MULTISPECIES: AraC family transcriptional regulator [Olsenella]EHF02494.1 hypothetical protein HMPREF1008_00139 [Olsenella sp. oral taxon 809 str. F0356]
MERTQRSVEVFEPLRGARLAISSPLAKGTNAADSCLRWSDGELLLIYCKEGIRPAHPRCASSSSPRSKTLLALRGRGEGVHPLQLRKLGGIVLLLDLGRIAREEGEALAEFGVDAEGLALLSRMGTTVASLDGHPELVHVLFELNGAPERGREGYLRLKVVELLRLLSHIELTGSVSRPPVRQSHRQIAYRAQGELMRDLSTPLTIEQLAEHCESSPTVLKQSFRETFGSPVYSWYRRQRMRRAAELLGDGRLGVSEVAAAVGYSNPSKFSRAFSACMGCSPSVWRARHMA